MTLKVKRIGGHSLPLPKYETDGASGFDLRAVIVYAEFSEAFEGECGIYNGMHYIKVPPGCSVTLRCGFAFEVPDGYELQVRPRSGLSAKGIVGTFGTVDSDYRGEVRVILTNQSDEPFTISNGDRVAQGVIAPVSRPPLVEVEELTPTTRGGNGFGSTGTR